MCEENNFYLFVHFSVPLSTLFTLSVGKGKWGCESEWKKAKITNYKRCA